MQHLNFLIQFLPKRSLLFMAPALLILSLTTRAQMPVLYGTSNNGGGADSSGAIYKINGDGSGFDTLYSFKAATGHGPLIMRMAFYNSKFYGTTGYGGANDKGVIFSFDPLTRTYTDLLDFNGTNGETPWGGLTYSGGKFYGLTAEGGAHDKGVLYSFDPVSNVYNKVFDFDSTNGSRPLGELFAASNGKLYGGTPQGGESDQGVIFSLTPPSTFQKIVDLDTTKGVSIPYSISLTDGGNGKVYGVAHTGGTNDKGVVFTLNLANNSYVKIYDFDSIHGTQPAAGMVLAANGKLYGTTLMGGATNMGTLFSIDPSNDVLTTLRSFSTVNDGYNLVKIMTKGSDNKLYSTAYQGGANSKGTIFSFDPSTNTFTKIHDCVQIDATPAGGLSEAIAVNTDIAPVTAQAVITVSPNPVTDMAVIRFSSAAESECRLTVTDVTGKVLMVKENVTPTGNQNTTIDLSSFSTGVYFLNVATAGQQEQSLKLVKE